MVSNVLFKNIKMFVFDIGGTIVNEGGIICSTLKNSIRNAGFQVGDNEIKTMYKKNKLDIIYDFVEDMNESKRIYSEYKRELKERYMAGEGLVLVDGVEDLFTELKNMNINVCLNSNFEREIVEHVVFKSKLEWLVDDYVGKDDVIRGKPWPYMISRLMYRKGIENPKQVIMVGDTVMDIYAGKNAGTSEQIGVLSGMDDYYSLREAKATRIIDSLDKLIV